MHTKYFPVSINPSTWVSKTVVLAFISILYTIRRLRKPHRLSKIAPSEERVLVLGASSGIGEAIALQYAERGAKICVVGRRKEKIMNVANECRTASERSGGDTALYSSRFLAFAGDFSEVNDMVNLRTMLEKEWQGVDTIIVAAGVSALRSLMDVAGVKSKGETFEPTEASESGIRNVVDVAAAASKGNYIGPLISAVTFIPLLSKSSKSPSILLVSSLASVIPAPTRTLYASTKAAGLILYQALSIEHPNISFSYILPSTVEGDFRASAIDGGEVVESDPNLYGLKRIAVAKRCIKAIDEGEKTIFMPGYMRLAHLLYWAWPSFIERKARKKYNFTA